MDRDDLWRYLAGGLDGDPEVRVREHVERCGTCQSVTLVDARLAALLRQKLGEETAPAFRQQIVDTLRREASGATAAAGRRIEAWWRRALRSPWTPRWAMAAVLVLLVLLPFRSFFQAPALAQAAAGRHVHHAPAYGGPLPSCCRDLGLGPGDMLGPPSPGCRIPELGGGGLTLIAAAHCTGSPEVNLLGYRSRAGATFSLYITDRVTEEFMGLRTRQADGLPEARYRVKDLAVTVWKRDGLVYFWVGPATDAAYDLILADLLHTDPSSPR
jgi:hypothetical protein